MRIRPLNILAALILLLNLSSHASYPQAPTSQRGSIIGCLIAAGLGIGSIAYGVYDWTLKRYGSTEEFDKKTLNEEYDELIRDINIIKAERIQAMKSLYSNEKQSFIAALKEKREKLASLPTFREREIQQLNRDASFEQRKQEILAASKKIKATIKEKYQASIHPIIDRLYKKILATRIKASPTMPVIAGFSLLGVSLSMLNSYI